MSQILDSLPSHYSHRILCSYFNPTQQIQVVRITNVTGWYFERVVFPRDRILFEAIEAAILEVSHTLIGGAILVDPVACSQLQVSEGVHPHAGGTVPCTPVPH